MKRILHYLYWPFNILLFKMNHVRFMDFKIFGLITVKNKGTFRLGKNIRINSSRYANVIGGDIRTSFVIKKGATLQIGNDISISNAAFYCNSRIIIDDHVMIGGSCKIWDSDFHPLDPEMRKENPRENFLTRPIHIKESAFIGGGSIILKGVTIGKNSIIGAGSVVSRNVPDNEIWAGNPAMFIKKLKGYE